jgi:hypothetical protein
MPKSKEDPHFDVWFLQLSPGLLVEKGLNICRSVQQPNEFMIIFPEAFTANIACGYNIAESMHFAPAEWIPQGWAAIKMLHENHEADVVSIERIILKLARSEKTPVETLSILLPHLQNFTYVQKHELGPYLILYCTGLRKSSSASSCKRCASNGKGSLATINALLALGGSAAMLVGASAMIFITAVSAIDTASCLW